MRRRWRLAAVIGACCLVVSGFAACGDDDDDDEGAQTDTTAQRGAPTVDIKMQEYAFVVSGPLTAGGTIKLSNVGKEFHMMGMGKLKPGATVGDVASALQEGGGEEEEGEDGTTTSAAAATTTTSLVGRVATTLPGAEEGEEEEGEEEEDPIAEFIEEEVGVPAIGLMGPGAAADVTAPDLESGNYVLLCFIPVEGGGPPHFAQGMIGSLTVTEGTAPAAPTADATYQVSPGKAITGPATLAAGRHVLKIEAAAGAGDLEPSLIKPDAGKTAADMDRVFDQWDESGPPKDAARQVPGDVIVSLHDFGDVATFYLSAELTAGTYELIAPDSDVEDAPAVPRERIVIRVT